MRRQWSTLLLILSLLFFVAAQCDGPIEEYTLTVEIEGMGTVVPASGTTVKEGENVVITVSPGEGHYFKGWEGPHGKEVVHVEHNEYRLHMDGDKSITAIFLKKVMIEEVMAENGMDRGSLKF